MPSWKKIVLDTGGSITQNTTGTASDITGIVSANHGGTGVNLGASEHADKLGILMINTFDSSVDRYEILDGSDAPDGATLLWDGTASVPYWGSPQLPADATANFLTADGVGQEVNDLTVNGTLTVGENSIFEWEVDELTTTANLLELASGQTLVNGDDCGLRVDTNTAGTAWSQLAFEVEDASAGTGSWRIKNNGTNTAGGGVEIAAVSALTSDPVTNQPVGINGVGTIGMFSGDLYVQVAS